MHTTDILPQPRTRWRRPLLELSLTGQPRSWQVREQRYRCQGYGRARWGMDMAAVMTVIAREHPKAQAGMRHEFDRLSGEEWFELDLPALPPGPGPARLRYVFDAEYGRLCEVHLHWISGGDPSQEQRLPLVQAATRLAGDLMSYRWSGLTTLRGAVRGHGALLLFSGRDEDGATVEISLDGVAFDVERPDQPGRPEHRPAPRGPAALRLSYLAAAWVKLE
ncbi:hypothetical protein GJ699_16025 [Duganella sp. FT80W]|uniref:Uncharacterized protein n=1 Tax=Duganella guangzhouensis TaxID=2666084 RepID=A0A6I2L055_9BURK|nr:hypothetical protein [Duganella guangzhouensis]MRW91501.1 hypothetical protein [Duganella guangzhouensis]